MITVILFQGVGVCICVVIWCHKSYAVHESTGISGVSGVNGQFCSITQSMRYPMRTSWEPRSAGVCPGFAGRLDFYFPELGE